MAYWQNGYINGNVIVGNLADYPFFSHAPGKKAMASIRVLANQKVAKRDNNGNVLLDQYQQPIMVDKVYSREITFFDKSAENIKKLCKKGTKILVECSEPIAGTYVSHRPETNGQVHGKITYNARMWQLLANGVEQANSNFISGNQPVADQMPVNQPVAPEIQNPSSADADAWDDDIPF